MKVIEPPPKVATLKETTNTLFELIASMIMTFVSGRGLTQKHFTRVVSARVGVLYAASHLPCQHLYLHAFDRLRHPQLER
jgi:hypothetical protein